MQLDNLSDLFQRGLEYAWDCEHLLAKDMPGLVGAASSPDLKQALDLHLAAAKAHIHRLDQVFTRLERAPAGEKSEPARIILAECERMRSHIEPSPLMDAVLIFTGNQIAHYKIGLYGSLSSFARVLGFAEAANLLDENLADEKIADQALTRIAETSVNQAATTVHHTPPFVLI